MLHLAIICMVCAVFAPIEGTALIGVNNNKSNIFCHVDEREQRQRGKFFPGLYNVDAKNFFNCAKRQVTDRTNCIFYNNVTKQCQFGQTLCSFKNKFPSRKKGYLDSQLEYTVRRRNVYSQIKNKGKMLLKKLKYSDAKKPEKPRPCFRLTSYERNKLRHLKKVGKKRKKRRTRKSHLDKVEIDDDLDINKRIEKLVKRIALENMRNEKSVVSPVTELVPVMDVSTRVSEDSSKGIAFPFFNNIKQIFRFSKEYFNSKRDSQNKCDITKTERHLNPGSNTMTEKDSENLKKSKRLRRNAPRHFIPRKLIKNSNRLRERASTLNTPNRVTFSAVKRKRRRRKRDHCHYRPRLGSSVRHGNWPIFNQMYSNYRTVYNDYDLESKEDSKINSTDSQKPENNTNLVVTTGSPPFHNSSSSSVNYTNNFSENESEPLTHRQRNGSNKGNNILNDYNNRNVFHHSLESPIRYDGKPGYKTSGFPFDRRRLSPGRYLKIRHALRNYIQSNNDWELRRRILFERKKRCERKCNNMPRKCWRSAPLLCIPYIRKGQDELLKYVIKTLQNMLGKPMPKKIDIFEKIKFKPCSKTAEPSIEDIVPGCESSSETETETETETAVTTCAPTTTTTTCKTTPPCQVPTQPCQSTTLSLPLSFYPAPSSNESASSNMSSTTTNCSSAETVTQITCSCSTETSTSPPCTTTTTACPTPATCPPPVCCPQSFIRTPPPTCPPSTSNSCSENTCALLIIGPSTTILPASGCFPGNSMAPGSGKEYSNDGYSTGAPTLLGTEPLPQNARQSQTQMPMNFYQMTYYDEKNAIVRPSENSANTASSKYPHTSSILNPSSSNFSSQPNKVTVRALAQGYTTEPSQVAVASTQEIQPPVTQNTPFWYFSGSPVEKSQIFTFTTLDCKPSSNPNLCYQYYQPFTPSSSDKQPQLSNQRQMDKPQMPLNMYVYKTAKPPIQRMPSMMGSRTANPLDFDLSYNDNAKPYRHFCELNTMRDYFPEPNPKEENSLREKNFAEPRAKFSPREEENLFPGDPLAYRYMDTTDRLYSKMMRPRWSRKKFPKFTWGTSRKLFPPSYDFDIDEPMYDEKYDRYYWPETSEREFNGRKRKTQPKKNQRREKREIFYKESYSWFKNSDNYDNYADDFNYDDQYPENILLPNLDLEENHWARKREEGQNSSTSGTYALFSELADIATLSPNETEKVCEQSKNTSSTRPVNKTVTNPPQKDSIDKFDIEQRSGYDNSLNPTVSILSAGHTTTTQKQISATTSGDTTTASLISTTLENAESTQSLKSNEEQKAEIVDSGKPDKEMGSNHDVEAGEEQVMTTLKTASIAKVPKKLFTKPAPKVYTKVYPDSMPNEMETNETPTTSTTPKTGADKTTVVQTLAAPDVRLQLLAVCEGYLEIVKLIKAQNQSLEEELDSDLSQYCENIISQSFDLPADNVVIKSKKPERSSPSRTTMAATTTATMTRTTITAQATSTNPSKIVSKRRSCDRYRVKHDGFSHQDLRAKVVVDILRSPIYKKDLEAYADQNNFYPKGRKTKRMSSQPLKKDDRGVSSRKYRYKEKAKKDFSNSKTGLRNQRKKLRSKEEMKEKFSKRRISEEEMELLHLLRQRKRALLSWLSNPNENRMKPNGLEETEYLDDDEYYTITAETTEDSGTITPKGDQETSESTTKTTFYANDTIFPVYAKQYGYDKGGELREVEVLWRRVNEETHQKKIFKNMSVLALLLTSTVAPYMKSKESGLVGGNVYETDEMFETESNNDNEASFVDPVASLNENPVTTALPPSSLSVARRLVSFQPQSKKACKCTSTTTSTTACSTTCSEKKTTSAITTKCETSPEPTSTTQRQTDCEIVQSNNGTKKNQTYIFVRKPDPSTIVGRPPNATKGHKNSTQKISRKFEVAKDFFQEYSIEFLNYAVYILPIMFTILFIMCCLCCFLQILNSRGGGRRKKNKKVIISTEEDCETTGDSENETKIRRKRKRKKSLKSNTKCENLENRRLRAFWNVLKINSRGKQRGNMCEETSTPTEKRRSFLQFLKGKKEVVKPEELASLSYPPPCERDEVSDEEAGISREVVNAISDCGMKVPAREKKEVDERREIISLLEELKKIELENLEEAKNKKSVCIQYMSQDKEKTVSKKPDAPCSYQVDKYFESSSFCDKRFPDLSEAQEDAGEFTELVPYEGEYIYRKNDSVRQSDYRINRGGRCERFFKMLRGSGEKMNFIKSGIANKSYIYNKYKNISTDTRDELMGGTHTNADTEKDLSDDMLDNFPPYSLQRNRQTDIVDEMENLKRQLNKKKTVRLKDNGVLCRL